MANYILDNNVTQLVVGGGNWSIVYLTRFYGGSAIWPAFATNSVTYADTGEYGSLLMTFQGTGITFFGNTPQLPASQWAFVSIDGESQYNTSYNDPTPPSTIQWYQSPVLSDGTHAINISHIAGTSVDFMVVSAGLTTPLGGQKIIVDDNSTEIVYQGNWALVSGHFIANTNPQLVIPYHNATHQAFSAGPSATFQFAGTSVEVFGVYDYSILGGLSLDFTIDGYTVTQQYNTDSNNNNYLQGIRAIPNTLFLYNNTLAAGNHTLVIEVNQCSGQNFALDYIIYTPSFASLSDKPNFGGPATTPQHNSKSTPVGAIVGGIVGGVALLLLLLALFFRKRLLGWTASRPDVRKRKAFAVDPFVVSPLAPPENTVGPVLPTSTSFSSLTPQRKPPLQENLPPLPGVYDPSNIGSGSRSSGKPLPFDDSSSPRSVTPPREMRSIGDGGPLVGGMFRNRMARLEELVIELNREIDESGEGSPRVAELRGRIAELTREDAQGSGTAPVLPPYEPRADGAGAS